MGADPKKIKPKVDEKEAFAEFLRILGKRITVEQLLREVNKESEKYQYHMIGDHLIIKHAKVGT